MRFIHQENKVVQPGEILEVALADVLLKALDARFRSGTHFGVDLADVEDVDVYWRVWVFESRNRWLNQPLRAHAAPAFIVVAGDDLRWLDDEVGQPLEDILWGTKCEVGNQLVVDRQVRGEHKEVADKLIDDAYETIELQKRVL